jgi:hypothetical protein
VAAGLVTLLAAGAFAAWPRPHRITRENFARIAEGMGRAEVEAILGPEGDYRTVPTELVYRAHWYTGRGFIVHDDDLVWGTPDGLWEGDAGNIRVIYRQGRVVKMAFVATERLEQSYLGNLRWRAERLWRRWFA